jgi:hypothetical protein
MLNSSLLWGADIAGLGGDGVDDVLKDQEALLTNVKIMCITID